MAIEHNFKELASGNFEIGGPEILTQHEIALQSFEVLTKNPKITYIPLWIRNIAIKLIRAFTSSKTYGPIEFFMTVLSMDMIAPTYGKQTIRQYFRKMSEGSDE